MLGRRRRWGCGVGGGGGGGLPLLEAAKQWSSKVDFWRRVYAPTTPTRIASGPTLVGTPPPVWGISEQASSETRCIGLTRTHAAERYWCTPGTFSYHFLISLVSVAFQPNLYDVK